jgi:hypothetical protein
MDSIIKVNLKFKDSVTQGEITLVNNSPSERLAKALKIFFYSILATVISIFIPILHFVLVPLFLLISIAIPLFIYYKKSYIKGGTGTCPNCYADIKIKPTSNNFPIHEICTGCNQYVNIWIAT